MPRAVWRSVLVSLVVCAGAHLLGAQEPVAATDQPLDAMLLPPVDGQLALWVNQPANFAVVGVAPDHGAAILYQQTALEGIPASGYVYVRPGDAGYDRVYLVASRDSLDLSGTLDDAMASASVLDAYATDTTHWDKVQCSDGDLVLVRTNRIDDRDFSGRILWRLPGGCPPNYPVEGKRYQHPYMFAGGRGFFIVNRPAPTHKSLPPGYRPPRFYPNLGGRLSIADQHALRWLAAKDEWHAVTHNGEPGTELPRALGYVQSHGEWVLGRSNPALAAVRKEVRAI